MRKRVILFGGSFDPIHLGHLHMAKEARKQLYADEVWFVVAKDAPLKDSHFASFEHRVSMVKRALAPYRKLSVCTVEQSLPSPSYTVDTVSWLIRKYPTTEFYFLIGDDQARQLHQWKKIEHLSTQVTFVIYPRTQIQDLSLPSYVRFVRLHGEKVDVSSTEIREGKSMAAPKCVLQYMIAHQLYDLLILKTHISEKRLRHVQSVSELAQSLAEFHHLNPQRMRVAAMYHDVAKQWPSEKLVDWMKRCFPERLSLPQPIWHAFVAKAYLLHTYKVYDRKVLKAIEHHVQGLSTDMYSKIIYLADKIEPTRLYDTSALISMAYQDSHQLFNIVKDQQAQYIGQEEK